MKKRDIWTIVFFASMVLMYFTKGSGLLSGLLVILWVVSIIMFFKYKKSEK